MLTLPEKLWIVALSGAKRKHLTRSNEEGAPLAKTLCGKIYDPGDRKSGSTKTDVITGLECDACVKKATYKRPWRFSRNDRLDEFKTHFLRENGRLACGQRMACYSVKDLAKVTCERCLDLA